MQGIMKAVLVAVSLVVVIPSWTVSAHQSESGDVSISHPWALPAKAGENTRLYFVLENEEQDRVTVTNMETPVARFARFQFQADSETVLSLSSRTIRSEETLNVASHHMWFELFDLRQDLIKGDRFPVALTFADGRIIHLSVVVGLSPHANQESE